MLCRGTIRSTRRGGPSAWMTTLWPGFSGPVNRSTASTWLNAVRSTRRDGLSVHGRTGIYSTAQGLGELRIISLLLGSNVMKVTSSKTSMRPWDVTSFEDINSKPSYIPRYNESSYIPRDHDLSLTMNQVVYMYM